MFNIAETLDRARHAQGLRSDYKLALVAGLSQQALSNYRNGKTLPDARSLIKISALSGDDPALMAAEIEFIRAKDDDARSIWSDIAERLKLTTKTAQAGFSRISMLVVVLLLSGLLAHAQTFAQSHAQQGLEGVSNTSFNTYYKSC